MPEGMNFRCGVTMATRPNQNNNKDKIWPNRKENNKNCIQMTYLTEITMQNFISCSDLVLHVREKRKGDTYLGDIQHSVHDGRSTEVLYPTNITTKI